MTHTCLTTLSPSEVIARAKEFFAQRVPLSAAYPEKEGPGFLVLRGQGGEEIALAVAGSAEGARIRASTLLFDQAVSRFLSTLPTPAVVPV